MQFAWKNLNDKKFKGEKIVDMDSLREANIRVPWARPYFSQEEARNISKTVETGWLSQGDNVIKFEQQVGKIIDSEFSVAVSSGTAALDVALKLMKIMPGDEIIVPAFSYIATLNCVLYQGATPVFVDVRSDTFNIDVDLVSKQLTPATKGIIAIDYAGQAANWAELRKLATEHGMFLIEDAAPALGGSYHDKALGTLGDIGITSFHTAKNFTSVEGGMIFTSNPEFEKRARMIRSHGESFITKYSHEEVGHNYRMSDLHAAVGLAQVSRFKEVIASRRRAAEFYTKELQKVEEITVPEILQGNDHAWFLYPILVENRDLVREKLTNLGIQTNVSWPFAAYQQPHLAKYKTTTCGVTEDVCKKVLCLPMFFGITDNELNLVVSAIRKII